MNGRDEGGKKWYQATAYTVLEMSKQKCLYNKYQCNTIIVNQKGFAIMITKQDSQQ
jgi:hypothetical protein